MRLRRGIILSLALILLALSAVMQVQSGDAGDKGWLLLAAKMWLSGKRLYIDIFEINPPFVIWLYAIPEWLSGVVPFSDAKLLTLMGLLTCGLSVWLGVQLIRLHPAFAGDARGQANFALLLAYVFVFFNTQVYFFDREHIFLVMMFPYMLRFMPSLAKRPLSLPLKMAIGLFAAAGFCIKPYTLIVFTMLQLLYIVRERSLAMLLCLENIIIYIGGALYLLCIWFFAREYIGVVLPVAMATYSGYNRRVNGYLYLALAFVSAGLTFVDLRLRHTTPYRKDAYYFIGVCVAFLGYALANNGWGYTYNPLLCMLLFTSGWMLWDYGWLKNAAGSRGESGRQFVFARQGCIANLAMNAAYMLLCIGTFFTTASCAKYQECNQNMLYAGYLKEHNVRSFGTITFNLRTWTTLVRQTGASWDTRFNHLWMLPGLLQGGDAFAARHQWIVDYIGNGLAEDMDNRKPDIVFVDANNGIFAYPHPVDMIAYLSGVAAFKEAWRNYQYSATIDQCAGPDPKAEQSQTASPAVQIDCRFDIYSRIRHARGVP